MASSFYPYTCMLALFFCRVARLLRERKHYREAAKVCRFVSKMCRLSEYPECKLESTLCEKVADYLERGNYYLAEMYCHKALKVCPRAVAVTAG